MGITTTTPTSTATPTKTQIDIFFLRPLQTTIVTKDYGHQKNNKYFIFVYCPLFAHLESLLGGWLWGNRWKSVQRKAIAAPHIETASSWSIGLMSKTSASISSWRQLLVYVSSLWHHVWSHYFLGRGARAPQYYNFCVIESCWCQQRWSCSTYVQAIITLYFYLIIRQIFYPFFLSTKQLYG